MAKQNLNPFSLFLVNWQQEGAEKALIKMTAALSLEELHLFFSFSLVRQSLSKPFQKQYPKYLISIPRVPKQT